MPNFLILESIERWDGFHGADRQRRSLGGRLCHPVRASLASASTFDEDVARAHPYEGDELHLMMAADELVP